MTSSSLQSRINIFETLSNPASVTATPRPILRKAPPPSRSHHPLDAAISPNATTGPAPAQGDGDSVSAPPSTSPTWSRRRESSSSFVDLKDWVVEDHPVLQNRIGAAMNSHGFGLPDDRKSPPMKRSSNDREQDANSFVSRTTVPLISLNPPGSRGSSSSTPPLPPRRLSTNPMRQNLAENATSSLKPWVPISQSVVHTYPPPDPASRRNHPSSNSASSFHSVSLSDSERDDQPQFSTSAHCQPLSEQDPLEESYENVSLPEAPLSRLVHPSPEHTGGGQGRGPKPPQLPQRPPKKLSSVDRPSTNSPSNTRHTPAPSNQPSSFAAPLKSMGPGSSRASVTSLSSDRSSILSGRSAATSHTSSSHSHIRKLTATESALARPTPVPPAARARFESLFKTNVANWQLRVQQQKQTGDQIKRARQAAGWRGLSVDLTTTGFTDALERDGRLSGFIVKRIWERSGLDKTKLKHLWNELDSQRSGSLDCESFVQGMWKIDQELRWAQIQLRAPQARQSINLLH